jgi:hypothetical protein
MTGNYAYAYINFLHTLSLTVSPMVMNHQQILYSERNLHPLISQTTCEYIDGDLILQFTWVFSLFK